MSLSWIDADISDVVLSPVDGPDLIDVSGEPYEQGLRHGRLAAATIAANLDVIDAKIRAFSDRQREIHQDILVRNTALFAAKLPDQHEEVQGIADGAGQPLERVLALNLPAFFVVGAMPLECSQIVIGPQRTSGGETLVAKTRDLNVGDVRNIVLRRQYPDGVRLVEGTVAGSITWPGSGLNSHGVAMSTSGVWSKRIKPGWNRADTGWFLVNSHDLLRRARTAKEFTELAEQQSRFTGINLAVADASESYAIELTASEALTRPGDDGYLVVTNHYQAPEFSGLTPTPDEYTSTFHRGQTAADALSARDDWSAESLAELLSSHDGYPQNCICRHSVSDQERAEKHFQTNNVTAYASIANARDLTFSIVFGNPCEATFSSGVSSHEA